MVKNTRWKRIFYGMKTLEPNEKHTTLIGLKDDFKVHVCVSRFLFLLCAHGFIRSMQQKQQPSTTYGHWCDKKINKLNASLQKRKKMNKKSTITMNATHIIIIGADAKKNN